MNDTEYVTESVATITKKYENKILRLINVCYGHEYDGCSILSIFFFSPFVRNPHCRFVSHLNFLKVEILQSSFVSQTMGFIVSKIFSYKNWLSILSIVIGDNRFWEKRNSWFQKLTSFDRCWFFLNSNYFAIAHV